MCVFILSLLSMALSFLACSSATSLQQFSSPPRFPIRCSHLPSLCLRSCPHLSLPHCWPSFYSIAHELMQATLSHLLLPLHCLANSNLNCTFYFPMQIAEKRQELTSMKINASGTHAQTFQVSFGSFKLTTGNLHCVSWQTALAFSPFLTPSVPSSAQSL